MDSSTDGLVLKEEPMSDENQPSIGSGNDSFEVGKVIYRKMREIQANFHLQVVREKEPHPGVVLESSTRLKITVKKYHVSE